MIPWFHYIKETGFFESIQDGFYLQIDVFGGFQTETVPKTEIDMFLLSQAAMFVCIRDIFWPISCFSQFFQL